MNDKSKIDKIEQLSHDEMSLLMSNLAKSLGYSNIQTDENIITAINKSPLSSEKFLFLLFNESLTGNIDVEHIQNKILEYQTTHIANVIFIISQGNISAGFEKSISQRVGQLKLNFLGRDKLISIIDSAYPDFWKHRDTTLIEYEKKFCESIIKDSELKKLKIFDDKYQKLLDIYIEPRLSYFYEDKATQTPVKKRVTIDDIIQITKPIVISGDAGAGKSTLLKKIGEKLIQLNTTENLPIRNIPLLISAMDIYVSNNNIENLIAEKLRVFFNEQTLTDICKNYKLLLLVDSVDEFSEEEQISILKDIDKMSKVYNIQYIISSRNSEKLSALSESKLESYNIERFNGEQVRRFISKFFLGEEAKTESLLDALRDNRIIERLPITPLTLSLISILYEENNLEIPATIADIYDNFNSLIVGRLTVSSRIEFIDISFKERILSVYALHLLERDQHTPLTKEDFFTFFTEYFTGKTLPIKKGTLEEVLDYLIANTGVLILKENKWVQFSHDSYMEYYAAVEIFKHKRDKEDLLASNFYDFRWQNSAIFYAGKSKDMPEFLQKIISEFKKANNLKQFMSGVLGCGYLLQALYQTDNKIREKAILEALELNNNSTDILLKLAADDMVLFKNYSLPILQIMNMFYFYDTFNSITIKEPLKMAFDQLLKLYKETEKPIFALNAINIAFILDSKRVGYPKALEKILEDKTIYKDANLYAVLDFSFGIYGGDKYNKLKKEIRDNYFPKVSAPVKELVKLPASRVRFSPLETLTIDKNVQLIVEGKTDAEIIEHAYYVLTNGNMPYWSIKTSGNSSGGANEVAKSISSCKPLITSTNIVIGLFDHDAKGLQEFRGGLRTPPFEKYTKDTVRKHIDCNIYGLLLPVPGEMDYYLKKDQQFNFFEIEHYFDISLLKNEGIVESTELPNIYKIKDSKKTTFSKTVRTITNKSTFIYFLDLFKAIDKITGIEIEYFSE